MKTFKKLGSIYTTENKLKARLQIIIPNKVFQIL